jgi:all-trans-retinol 13,14-reductase
MSAGADARDWDTIVIGSGVGGLGAAAFLARQGQRVLVVERHTTAGGLTHTFRRRGFEWDVGVHYVGKVHDDRELLRRLFDYASERRLGWRPMPDVYDEAIFGDDRYRFAAGAGPFVAGLAERFPSEHANLEAYVRRVQRTARWAEAHFVRRALPRWADATFGSLLSKRFAADARRSTADVLTEVTGNARLRSVLAARWGNHGLPPRQSTFVMHALVADFYLGGGSYPDGGGASIARTLGGTIERAGGRVMLGAPAARILLHCGRAVGVELGDGRCLRAGAVVSNAGVRATFGRLLPADACPRENAAIASLPDSSGHCALYLGLDRPASAVGLTGANRWIHAGYDHDANLGAYLADPERPVPLVYLSSPSAKDTASSRSAVASAIVPAPYRWFEPWRDGRWRKRGPDYEALKAGIAARIRAEVVREVPAIADAITYEELSTPLSTEHFVGHEGGAMYGLDHTSRRLACDVLGPTTPIEGLYLAGQDVLTVGVGASLMSGLFAASARLGRNLLPAIFTD